MSGGELILNLLAMSKEYWSINAFYSISYPLVNTFLPLLYGTDIQYNIVSTPYYFDLLHATLDSKNWMQKADFS